MQLALGHPPQRADVVLSTSRLQHVSDYDAANFTLTAQAGVTCAAVARLTADNLQTLPLHYAFSPATLGGLIATNADNPKRLMYGGIRDLLLGIRVALTNGEIVHFGGKVVKNVAGYDMARLFLGSLGTLGVIVEATFKLYALPERDETLFAVFPTWSQAAAASAPLLSAPLLTSQILLLNAATAHYVASIGAVHEMESAPPSIYPTASLHQGECVDGEELAAAEIPAGGALLLVNVEGVDEAVERQLRELSHLCRGQEAAAVGVIAGEQQVQLRQRLAALALAPMGRVSPLLHASSRDEAGSTGDRIIVRLGTLPSRVPMVMEAIARALNPVTSQAFIVGDCGVGLVRLTLGGENHWSELVDAPLLQVLGDLPQLVAAEGGSAVIEAAPLVVKERLDVWGARPAAFSLLKALKAKFDPGGILNPGRFIGGL
jgi:glycolate oxidase FAD binding subunit